MRCSSETVEQYTCAQIAGCATSAFGASPSGAGAKSPSVCSDVLRGFAQSEFLDLAGGGLGELGEYHVARYFEFREVFPAPGDQLLRGCPPALAQLNERTRSLAPF